MNDDNTQGDNEGIIILEKILSGFDKVVTKEEVKEVFQVFLNAIKDVKDSLEEKQIVLSNDTESKISESISEAVSKFDEQFAESKIDKSAILAEMERMFLLIQSIPKPEVIDTNEINERAVDVTMDRVLPLIPKIPNELTKPWREEVEEIVKGMIKDAIKKIPTPSNGGANYSDGRSLRAYVIPTLNGSTKTFSLPAFWRVVQVLASSAPWNLKATTDYTVNGSTYEITFTSEISAVSTLGSDQTVTILYVEN